ncbi:MAG TPA: alpha/beta hydrolase, partial [Eubacteriales bacterium]|nr:alpha/beta hydrolase [Eubacteriales bacterium]
MPITERVIAYLWKQQKPRDDARLALQSPPKGVKEFCDIAYIEDGDKFHLLDVYLPENAERPLPVIFEIHGGGWTYGDKDLNKIYAMNLAARGFGVVNISYRLMPEVRLKEQLLDIFAAAEWLMNNGKDYGLDTQNVFVNGDSAGGHLAVTTAAIAGSEKFQKLLGINPGINFRAAGSSCGALALDLYERWPLLSGLRRMFFGKHAKKHPLYALSAPMKFLKAGDIPPVFLSSCDKDFIRAHTLAFSKFCEREGIEHQTIFYYIKDSANKLQHVYDVVYPEWKESKETIDALC